MTLIPMSAPWQVNAFICAFADPSEYNLRLPDGGRRYGMEYRDDAGETIAAIEHKPMQMSPRISSIEIVCYCSENRPKDR